MQNDPIRKANDYYHKLYPNTVIFYRIGEYFTAYREDATKVAIAIGEDINGHIPGWREHCEGLSGYMVKPEDFTDCAIDLFKKGITARSITYRDSEGRYSLPDVDLIQKEQEVDY